MALYLNKCYNHNADPCALQKIFYDVIEVYSSRLKYPRQEITDDS